MYNASKFTADATPLTDEPMRTHYHDHFFSNRMIETTPQPQANDVIHDNEQTELNDIPTMSDTLKPEDTTAKTIWKDESMDVDPSRTDDKPAQSSEQLESEGTWTKDAVSEPTRTDDKPPEPLESSWTAESQHTARTDDKPAEPLENDFSSEPARTDDKPAEPLRSDDKPAEPLKNEFPSEPARTDDKPAEPEESSLMQEKLPEPLNSDLPQDVSTPDENLLSQPSDSESFSHPSFFSALKDQFVGATKEVFGAVFNENLRNSGAEQRIHGEKEYEAAVHRSSGDQVSNA
jgi:uncharacterized protein YjbJ (UPF0337 family)